jgi:hypothetical protein
MLDTPFARGLGAWDRATAGSAVGAFGGCDDEHSQAQRRVGYDYRPSDQAHDRDVTQPAAAQAPHRLSRSARAAESLTAEHDAGECFGGLLPNR